jgi:hypothetical protein
VSQERGHGCLWAVLTVLTSTGICAWLFMRRGLAASPDHPDSGPVGLIFGACLGCFLGIIVAYLFFSRDIDR